MDDPGVAQLVRAAQSYFEAVRVQGIVFSSVGVLGLGLGAFLWRRPQDLSRGLAWSLGSMALLQLWVGVSMALEGGRQLDGVVTQRLSISAELDRMQVVLRTLGVTAWCELGLLGLGLVVFVLFRTRPALRGAGLGLVLQCAILLPLDLSARERAATYVEALDHFLVSAGNE